jgi:PD-(D/E)XK endonuclease
LWRVQVKSTYVARAHSYIINAKGSTDGKRQAYTATQIDILVAYVVADDAWYVIPVGAFAPRTQLKFYPSGSKKGGLYEKYREAWHLMKAEPDNRDFAGSHTLGRLLPR